MDCGQLSTLTLEALGQRVSCSPVNLPAPVQPGVAWLNPHDLQSSDHALRYLLVNFSLLPEKQSASAFFPACEFALVPSSKTHLCMHVCVRLGSGSSPGTAAIFLGLNIERSIFRLEDDPTARLPTASGEYGGKV